MRYTGIAPALTLPEHGTRLLLHSCCAPCACDIIDRLARAGVDFAVYFYNPNIHPQREYLLRKDENKRFCVGLGVPFVDADYDTERWFARTQGQEDEPERGARCTSCFDMRFEATARYARRHGYDMIATTLGISRWKDLAQVNACGQQAAAPYPDLHYWDCNWRKQGGSDRMVSISKRERFYQQEYCGCVYSLRDTNRRRRQQHRDTIKIGVQYYS